MQSQFFRHVKECPWAACRHNWSNALDFHIDIFKLGASNLVCMASSLLCMVFQCSSWCIQKKRHWLVLPLIGNQSDLELASWPNVSSPGFTLSRRCSCSQAGKPLVREAIWLIREVCYDIYPYFSIHSFRRKMNIMSIHVFARDRLMAELLHGSSLLNAFMLPWCIQKTPTIFFGFPHSQKKK